MIFPVVIQDFLSFGYCDTLKDGLVHTVKAIQMANLVARSIRCEWEYDPQCTHVSCEATQIYYCECESGLLFPALANAGTLVTCSCHWRSIWGSVYLTSILNLVVLLVC